MAGMQQRLAQWHSGDECATPYSLTVMGCWLGGAWNGNANFMRVFLATKLFCECYDGVHGSVYDSKSFYLGTTNLAERKLYGNYFTCTSLIERAAARFSRSTALKY